jgi:immune inhibitor A
MSSWPLVLLSLLTAVPVLHADKSRDQPNPLELRINRERLGIQNAVRTGTAAPKTASAEAYAAKAGTDKVLVILVEFGGPDTFDFTPTGTSKSTWDPIGKPDDAEWAGSIGDCSKIVQLNGINAVTKYTYSGPLHNAIERPRALNDSSGNMMWAEDFTAAHYNRMIFGDGLNYSFKRQDGSDVNVDMTGKSVRSFYADMSSNLYKIEGQILGWIKVPHSAMWYGADQCPGARSAPSAYITTVGNSGAIPNAGTARSLVTDALTAAKASYPNFDWSQFDVNKDGLIDRLWIIHAGLGEEDSRTLLGRMAPGEGQIWSHSGTLSPYVDVASGVKAGPYIVMPENSGVNVLAHEFGHNLGAMDLYAYGSGEPSAGIWTIMSDSWTGDPLGSFPQAYDPLHLDGWGWLDPRVISDTSKEYLVNLGQASGFPGAPGSHRAAKIQLEDGLADLPVRPSGSWYWWGGQTLSSDSIMTLANPVAIPSDGTPALNFDLAYATEKWYDFLWVQVSSNGGKSWTTLTNTHTICSHYSDWEGGLRGFPTDLCTAKIGGFTGTGSGYPNYTNETFDLTAYKGQQILVRLWYMTDYSTSYAGVFIDNVRISASAPTLFSDGAETSGSAWTYSGEMRRTNGTYPYQHSYYLQWRNTTSTGAFDSTLGKAAYRYGPVDGGMIVWYNNLKYDDNEAQNHLTEPPSFGPKARMLVVDSHPEPYRDPDTVAAGYVNEVANLRSRVQMRDAAFSLLAGAPFTARQLWDPLTVGDAGTWVTRPVTFPGQDAVARFSDSQGYYPGAELVTPTPSGGAKKWMTKQWDSSVVIPSKNVYGMKAPGYTAGTELLSNCSKASDGSLDCRPVSNQTSHSINGGTGNPSDVSGQYGWSAQVLSQSDKQGAVQVWNGTKDPTLAATSAATFLANAVSPGQLVTFFGSSIGPATLVSLQLTAGGLVSTTLGGTRVLFDGVAAPLIYSYATQVSAVVPYAVKSKTYTEVQIEYQGRLTKKLVLPVAPSMPGLFTLDSSGRGPAAALNQDGKLNSASNPAAVNSSVVFWGTGEGETTPAGVDGLPATASYPKPVLKVSATVGGITATVDYLGAAPYFVAGVFQLNVKIPAGVTPGNAVPVVVKVGDVESPAVVTIAVK